MALPAVLSNQEVGGRQVDAGGVSIGGAIAIAGLAGVFAGRKPVPIAENVQYNARLIASWEQRNRDIAAENERRRRWAPLRIEVVRQ